MNLVDEILKEHTTKQKDKIVGYVEAIKELIRGSAFPNSPLTLRDFLE